MPAQPRRCREVRPNSSQKPCQTFHGHLSGDNREVVRLPNCDSGAGDLKEHTLRAGTLLLGTALNQGIFLENVKAAEGCRRKEDPEQGEPN